MSPTPVVVALDVCSGPQRPRSSPPATIRVGALACRGADHGASRLASALAGLGPDTICVVVHDDVVMAPGTADRLAEAVAAGATYAVPMTNDAGTDHHHGPLPRASCPDDLLIHQSTEVSVRPVARFRPVCVAGTAARMIELVERRLHDPLCLLDDVAGDTVAVQGAVAAHANDCVAELERLGREAPGPVLVANLIVRDEQDDLAACLDTLDGVVDRIEIADTGSTDATLEVLAARGLEPLHRVWRDDFGWARNEVLERSRDAEWVLWIDADERCVPVASDLLRGYLHAFASELDVLEIEVCNRTDDGGDTFLAPRLLNARTLSFEGRLHERPVRRDTGSIEMRVGTCGLLALDHLGYRSQVVTSRGKAERNRSVAEAAYAAAPTPKNALDLARSLTADRHADPRRISDLFGVALSGIHPQSHRELAWVHGLHAGHLLKALEDPAGAVTEARRGLALVPGDWGCRAAAAAGLNRLGRHDDLVALHDELEAARSLRPMTHGAPFEARCRREVAAAQLSIGRIDEAWASLSGAARRGPLQTDDEIALVLDVARRRGGPLVERLVEAVEHLDDERDRALVTRSIAASEPHDVTAEVVRRRCAAGPVEARSVVIGAVVDVAGGGDADGILDHARGLSADQIADLAARLTRLERLDLAEHLVNPRQARRAERCEGSDAGSVLTAAPPVVRPGGIVVRVLGTAAPGVESALRRAVGDREVVVADDGVDVSVTDDGVVVVVPDDVVVDAAWLGPLVAAADRGEVAGVSLATREGVVVHAGATADGRPVAAGDHVEVCPFVETSTTRRLLAPFAGPVGRCGGSEVQGRLLGGVVARACRAEVDVDGRSFAELVGPSVVIALVDPDPSRPEVAALLDAVARVGARPVAHLVTDQPDEVVARLRAAGVVVAAAPGVGGSAVACEVSQLVGALGARAVATDDVTLLADGFTGLAEGQSGCDIVWVGGRPPAHPDRVDVVVDAPAEVDRLVAALQRPVVEPAAPRLGRIDPVVTSPDVVSVVVPVHGKIELTLRCLDAVRRTAGRRIEIVVVDDASPDDTADRLAGVDDLRLVRAGHNRGFPGAANLGMAAATGRWICVLNNDTEPVTGWLDELIGALAVPGTGLVGPRSNLIAGLQRVRSAPLLSDHAAAHRWATAWSRTHAGSSFPVRVMTGMCVMSERSTLARHGGFDEAFGRGNGEDDELCDRLRRAGLGLRVANGAVVLHHGSATFRDLDVDYPALVRDGLRRAGPPFGCADGAITGVLLADGDVGATAQTGRRLLDVTDRVVVLEAGARRLTDLVAGSNPRLVSVEHLDWHDQDAAMARWAELGGAAVLVLRAGERLELDDHGEVRVELERRGTGGAAVHTPRGPRARLLPGGRMAGVDPEPLKSVRIV